MKTKRTAFINRELSWLEFNNRVLEEAMDPSVPLLEGLKFLAISASNLDEFFMVRVGSLELLIGEGIRTPDATGMTPEEQLGAVGRRVRRMVDDQYTCFTGRIEPGAGQHGLRRYTPETLHENQAQYLREVFEETILPVVTPMAVTAEDAFPFLANLALHMAVRIKPEAQGREDRFAVIPIGRTLDRFVTLPAEDGYAYILIEDVIRMFLARLLPGMAVLDTAAFRLTRNADLSVREDEAADFMALMQDVLQARKRSTCVRLEIEEAAGAVLRGFLEQRLDVSARGAYRVPGPLRLADFMKLASMEGFAALKYAPWTPQPYPGIDLRNSLFEEMKKGSVLLCHPYDSFEPVMRLVEEAARDPDVLAIKQVLYRTSTDSPIVAALKQAAERGKAVTAIVELKARFDEARNIEWARTLEEAGVQVIYGVRGLKTHAKVCVVVRREPEGVRRYVHFGTGNYNEKTARLYSDVSYLTCDEALASDATAFFNAVTGYSEPQRFRKLEMAPLGLNEALLALIESEAERKRRGQDALIMAKMNSLADEDIIRALCKASQAGVPIRLNVRGICCLRPGVKGISENITVVSVVDRFLEHSRILYFLQSGDEKLFISSADWMPRNLKRRVELMVPVEDAPSRRRLIATLETYFRDTVKGRRLQPDGSYARLKTTGGGKAVRSQEVLYLEAVERTRQAQQVLRRTFEPHRSPEAQL